jgi:hypothetical protein
VNILWLPLDYRSTCEAIWDQTVVLGHLSGRLSFLQFGQGPKLIGLTEREAMKGREEPASDPEENVSCLDSEGALSISRRHRLLRKIGLR